MSLTRGARCVAVVVALGLMLSVPAPSAAADDLDIPSLPTLVTRAQFLEMGSLVGQRSFTQAQMAAVDSYVAYLCGARSQPFTPLVFTMESFDQIVALEGVLQYAKQSCGLPESKLEFERGFLVFGMTRAKKIMDKYSQVSASQESDFCSYLKASKRVTKPLLLSALEEANIIKKADRGVVGLGITLVISNCSSLLDAI
jgi:hypothetical protein